MQIHLRPNAKFPVAPSLTVTSLPHHASITAHPRINQQKTVVPHVILTLSMFLTFQFFQFHPLQHHKKFPTLYCTPRVAKYIFSSLLVLTWSHWKFIFSSKLLDILHNPNFDLILFSTHTEWLKKHAGIFDAVVYKKKCSKCNNQSTHHL